MFDPQLSSSPQCVGRKEFPPGLGGSDVCHFCSKRVYVMERLSAEGFFFHRGCFRCHVCNCTLRLGGHAFHSQEGAFDSLWPGKRFLCTYSSYFPCFFFLLVWISISKVLFVLDSADWMRWLTADLFLLCSQPNSTAGRITPSASPARTRTSLEGKR